MSRKTAVVFWPESVYRDPLPVPGHVRVARRTLLNFADALEIIDQVSGADEFANLRASTPKGMADDGIR